MKQAVNQVYKPLFQEHPRYFILMGGRGAGRSTVASQYAMARLVAPEYFRCAIMRYVLGDIRNSIYREITDRAAENGVLDNLRVNDSVMTIQHGLNMINAHGFKKSSGDQKAKLKSLANYNCVIIEEADEIPEADFMQLDDSLRTLKGDITIILLLNPPSVNHWIVKRWFDVKPSKIPDFYIPKLKEGIKDTFFIRTSYKDNITNIAPQSVENYEAYRHTKPLHYWSMIRGLVSEVVRGKIYSGWRQIDDVPHEAELVRYGLDFGYTNDPTAIIAVYKHNGGLILDEVAYSPGLQNNQIAAILEHEPKAVIIADSSDPKSIDNLKEYKLAVLPSVKGADSIVNGIDLVQQKRISITKRSANLWKEYNNYAWMEDKAGETINQPKPGYDHGMDALRYAITSMKSAEIKKESTAFEPERPLYSAIGL